MPGQYWDGLDNPRNYPHDPNARNYIANQEQANTPRVAPPAHEAMAPGGVRRGVGAAIVGALVVHYYGGPWIVGAIGGFVVGYYLQLVVTLAAIGLIGLLVANSMAPRTENESAVDAEATTEGTPVADDVVAPADEAP